MKQVSAYPFVLWSAVAVIFLTFALALSGAPIPKGKELIRPEINGAYEMSWHRSLYDTYFLKGGDYVAVTQRTPGSEQSRWEGSWWLEGDVIHIKEQRVISHTGERHEFISYKFTLEKGKLKSINGQFALKEIGK